MSALVLGDMKIQNGFTADSQRVQLKSADLEAILALIDIQMEAIIEGA